jgi:hypothetical protein
LNHWDGLVRFLEDGRIELDTNIVERGMRPIVLISGAKRCDSNGWSPRESLDNEIAASPTRALAAAAKD